jgi:WhiB family redox-sensing transcriptional regulator
LDLFYGPPHERAEARQVREEKALAVCAACLPATRAVCLEAALVPGPTGQHGVQGGHTADERIRIRRDRMRKTARRAA